MAVQRKTAANKTGNKRVLRDDRQTDAKAVNGANAAPSTLGAVLDLQAIKGITDFMRANGVVYLSDNNPAFGQLVLQISEKAINLPVPEVKPDLERYMKEKEAALQRKFEQTLLGGG